MRNKKIDRTTFKINVVTNLILGTLLVSVGALCFAPIGESITAETAGAEIYRYANTDTGSVSVMFNVYMGTEETYKILDVLEKYDAKATFFIGGCWADDNVECLRAIHSKGHEIGNHGYFHKDHSKLSQENNRREIEDCNRFIELTIGQRPTLFAPPSGAYGDAMLGACQTLGMKTILWSKDTIDWRDQDVKLIYKRATKEVKGGDFILMHPTPSTVVALEDILKYYQEHSLKTVTVSQNLSAKQEV
ncbi:MAG: polysaccharide deacetylase family protein [Clostridia bacterium]|nr:polysaccharide deacetylase family protein [Clostridia bacterium]